MPNRVRLTKPDISHGGDKFHTWLWKKRLEDECRPRWSRPAGVDADVLDELIGQRAEESLIKPGIQRFLAIVTHRSLAKVGIGLLPDIQRVMPSDVQRDGFSRLPIREVMELLKNQRSERDLKILCRASEVIAERFRQITDRQVSQQSVPKTPGPTSHQQSSPPFPKKSPGIEKIPALMIAYRKHDANLRANPNFNNSKSSTFCRRINCCVLRNFLSGGFLHDSVFEGTSFDDECDLFVAA